MNNFNLLNSPGIYALLTYLRENENNGIDEDLLKSARECQVHNTMKVPRYAVLMASFVYQDPNGENDLVKLYSS